jgi:uncharacterized protein
MSQENVEVSRRSWDRFLADDIPGTLAFLDPEIEVHDVPGLPDTTIYHGHRGFLDQIEKAHDAFSEITYEPLEFIDAGDKIVGVIKAKGTAKTGGIEHEVTYGQVENWRDGKIVMIRYFTSREEALEAVGLTE